MHAFFLCSMLVFGMALAAPPNIVFILTDDQDLILGSADHQPQVQELLAKQGATIKNFYTTTPVCCPSRSGILSGRYIHNIPMQNNSIAGNCSSRAWQNGPELTAFAPYLQKAGYHTFFAGKYLNDYGFPAAGGVAHVPPGWTRWVGLVGNSIYYDYTLSIDGVAEKHGTNYATDYLPDLVANHSLQFIRNHANDTNPLFVMVSPPSCHDPTEPAPQYADSFVNITAPRTPNYNVYDPNKEWFVANQGLHFGMSDPNRMAYGDLHYRRRLATLLSVDDMVARIVAALKETGRLDNTYIFYGSDNGYHHGQFGMMKDKRTPYEHDTHLPAFVRGPGIAPGSVVLDPVTNIDFHPTFLDIAGVPAPAFLDGRSVLSVLKNPSPAPAPRSFLIEYSGEYSDGGQAGGSCAPYDTATMECGDVGEEMTRVPPKWTLPNVCSCEDSRNQTYRCVRGFEGPQSNYIYCEFFPDFWGTSDNEGEVHKLSSLSSLLSPSAPSSAFAYPPIPQPFHVEYYAIDKDPWQLKNAVSGLTPEERDRLHSRLMSLATCSGSSC